jgi:hypothetical protein
MVRAWKKGGALTRGLVTATFLGEVRQRAIGVGCSVFALTFSASAQEMLDHGFVEPCTLSNVAEQRLECEVCPSAVGSRECREKLAPKGFARKCRTRGGHTGWEEIWCKPRVVIEEKPPSETWKLVLGAVGTLGAMAIAIKVISGKG